MKSAMPFFGVTVPQVKRIVSLLVHEHPFADADAWQDTLLDIWRRAAKREERYAAVACGSVAAHRRFAEALSALHSVCKPSGNPY